MSSSSLASISQVFGSLPGSELGSSFRFASTFARILFIRFLCCWIRFDLHVKAIEPAASSMNDPSLWEPLHADPDQTTTDALELFAPSSQVLFGTAIATVKMRTAGHFFPV
jgi:hypothetical protein